MSNSKFGYVSIIGKPNSGKSTLINALVGSKISIVTSKPQTTRKRVLGILTIDSNDFSIHNTPPTQIIFLDTPGILNPKYQMQSVMMGYVQSSIDEADCIIYIYDVSKFNINNPIPNDISKVLNDIKIKHSKKKIILLLNKLDLLKDRKELLPIIAKFNESCIFSNIVPISALKKNNLKEIISTISGYLPDADFLYDVELLSTQPERFFVSEIIRENIFLMYSDEIPYSTEINIVEFKERKFGKWFINAEIIIEKQSQKSIIIGEGGEKLKKLMERSRLAIEEHLGVPIYLETFVKVREKWRNNSTYLRSFGY